MKVLERWGAWSVYGLIGVVILSMPGVAQPPGPEMQQALDLFFEGHWEQATESFYTLLDRGELSKNERVQAQKFIGICHTLLDQEAEAVEIFKKLVREDPSFSLGDLNIKGEEPPPAVIRYFGEAVLKVRQEEIQKYEEQLRRTSRQAAFMRSLALPGWGQRYQGYRGRGIVLLGLTAASIGYAAWAEVDFRDARDAYDRAGAGADFDKLYMDYQDKADLADLTLMLVGGLWAWNVVDAAVQGPNITRQGVSLRPVAGGEGVQLVYLRRF